MAKIKQSKTSKVDKYIKKFQKHQFSKHPTDDLVCNFCNNTVSVEKKFTVDSHRETALHFNGL